MRLASMLVVVASAAAVRAQALPSEPIALADGRVTVGGDVSATFGSPDPGFFNYTDYEHSALRLVRIDVAAAAKAGPHFSLLGEVRIGEHRHAPGLRAVRAHPAVDRHATSTSRSAGFRRRSARSAGAPTRTTTRSSAIRWPTST